MNEEESNSQSDRLKKVPMPDKIKELPRDKRGYPIPKFVSMENGVPNFVVADGRFFFKAVQQRLCWICGQEIGQDFAFVVGPSSVISKEAAEPPSHRLCAKYAVQVCPFIVNPNMKRLPSKYPEGSYVAGGYPLFRNPGVTAIWVCRDYNMEFDGNFQAYLTIGAPYEISWWKEGRIAKRSEVLKSITEIIPKIRGIAEANGPESVARVEKAIKTMNRLFPRR